jgi:hypothetical protein
MLQSEACFGPFVIPGPLRIFFEEWAFKDLVNWNYFMG